MQAIWQDIKRSIRDLARNPGFAAVAILTLALGVGANTSVFTVVRSIVLRELPVPHPEQITALYLEQKGGLPTNQFSAPDYSNIARQGTDIFSGVSGYALNLDGLVVEDKAERIMTSYVTGDFFNMLNVRPALGRFIQPADGDLVRRDAVMVLSYRFWTTRFRGDPNVVGRKVTVNGQPVTIIGIAPRGFYGFTLFDSVQAYLPMGMWNGAPQFASNRGLRFLMLFARLKPAITLQQARNPVAAIGDALSRETPDIFKNTKLQIFSQSHVTIGDPRTDILAIVAACFFGLTLLALLLACINIANILLVRTTARARDFAILAAVGASRWRLTQKILTESLVIAALGGIAGLFAGRAMVYGLSFVNFNTDMAVSLDVGYDWTVFGFGCVAVLVTGIFIGIVPAIRMSSAELASVLRDGSRGTSGGKRRIRNVLVGAQVSASFALLVIAGLFVRNLDEVQRVKLGFDPDGVLLAGMNTKLVGYSEAQGRLFYGRLMEHFRTVPGVVSVSTSHAVPMGYYNPSDTVVIDGYQPPPGQPLPRVAYNRITPDYFKAMKIAVLAGREFAESDDENANRIAIVDRRMARLLWPNQDPIGRSFRQGSRPNAPMKVVGVVDEVLYWAVGAPLPYFYIPFAQNYSPSETLELRTATSPTSMIPEVRRFIATDAPQLPVFDVKTMRQGLYTANGFLLFEVGAGLAMSLGILGLVLANIGVYGVVSFTVAQRTCEMGIRMAVGATSRAILRLILVEGMIVVTIGLIAGAGAAIAAGSLLQNILTINPVDGTTYLVVSLILAFSALAACYLPARRAARLDPKEALKFT